MPGMGEMLPVMLARIDEVSAHDVEHLSRPPWECFHATVNQLVATIKVPPPRQGRSGCVRRLRPRATIACPAASRRAG
jgi:hypothetical protein